VKRCRAAALVLFLAAPASADPTFGERLAASAARQVGVTTIYDGSYRKLPYPGGDVPMERGVCTDVVVRAYRTLGFDLQKLVHEDVVRAPRAYPKLWGNRAPDRNIDHRRVPNLRVYFSRHGAVLPITRNGADYAAGDLVTWRLPSGLPHIGLVSAEKAGSRPKVVHNIGAGAQVEDSLFEFEITGHYRWKP
jgi:uncharacterized protein